MRPRTAPFDRPTGLLPVDGGLVAVGPSAEKSRLQRCPRAVGCGRQAVGGGGGPWAGVFGMAYHPGFTAVLVRQEQSDRGRTEDRDHHHVLLSDGPATSRRRGARASPGRSRVQGDDPPDRGTSPAENERGALESGTPAVWEFPDHRSPTEQR